MLNNLKILDGTESETLFLPGYFQGRTQAYGFFETPFGRIKKLFQADISGQWENETFVMNESFSFDDGTKDTRSWELTPLEAGSFRAYCPEMKAPVIGYHDQRMAHLSYQISLPVGRFKLTVKYKDLFVLMNQGLLFNRALVSKWGLPVGRVSIVFAKT